jgi:hypothetical protein
MNSNFKLKLQTLKSNIKSTFKKNKVSKNHVLRIQKQADLEKLKDSNIQVSYLSILYNNLPDDEVIRELFDMKLKNRNVFLLLELRNVSSIKDIIKTAIEYGCDGFILTDKILEAKSIINIVTKLPTPYDFNWKVLEKNNCNILQIDDEKVNLKISKSKSKSIQVDDINNIDYPTSNFINGIYNKTKAVNNKLEKRSMKVVVNLKLLK